MRRVNGEILLSPGLLNSLMVFPKRHMKFEEKLKQAYKNCFKNLQSSLLSEGYCMIFHNMQDCILFICGVGMVA